MWWDTATGTGRRKDGAKQMRNTKILVFMGSAVFLSLTLSAVAAPVEIVGTLQNVDGVSLSGIITVIQETPHVTFTHHEVDKSGLFKIAIDSEGELVLHASARNHPPAEHVIAAGTTGVVTVNFVLALGQDVEVKVVDALGQAVPGAELRVRYHEPHKPIRRLSDEPGELTDGDGLLLLRDVGIQVPFFVDVLAPNYPPASSKLTKLEVGDVQMEDIVLGEPGTTVVAKLLDKAGDPVPDVSVTLLADPAGLPEESRGSWLHSRGFRQRAVTSDLGNVRFTGVPPGRVIVRVKTLTDSTEQRAVAVSDQELQVSLVLP